MIFRNLRNLVIGAIIGLSGLSVISPALAQPAEGKEYTLVNPPQPTESDNKIEVLEFFSYGCIHCYRLHPYVKKWAANLPNDVVFKRVPITFGRAAMQPMAKLYYTLEATGDLARLDDAVFAAVHDEKIGLVTDAAVLDWAESKGVNISKFTQTYNSFGVNSKVSRGDQLAKNYQVQGTPAVYVNGRYAVRNEGIAGYESIMQVTDSLINLSRSTKKAPKARGIRG